MTLAPGTRLGPYEVLSPIGAGGMGEVYRAKDSKLKREVAIKVLPQALAADADALARFEREALAVAALSHPNILSIFDFGTQDGISYEVTELLEGETLREKLDSGPIPQKQVVDYALQVAKGLSAAHEKSIVHRDLKPENLFITRDGHLKILDFGLAKRTERVGDGAETSAPTESKHTEPGVVMGTVGYMSPEQVRGLPLDHRSDIFSFGAVLYEMLSGRTAFKRDTAADTMSAILKEEPRALSESGRNISPALDQVIKHCLEKDRSNRFQSAKDIVFVLSQASGASTANGAEVKALAPRRAGVLVTAAAVLAAIAVGGIFLARRSRETRARAAGPKRIAVLPFENLGAAEDGYFADGMTDEVRSKLARLSALTVIASASSGQYKATTKPPEQIARELGVGYLLVAKVRWQKSGPASRIRVSPELVDVSGGGAPTTRWQEAFDADLADVFKVQGEIATRVARSLDIVLSGRERGDLTSRPTSNVEAYAAYLKGIELEERGASPRAQLQEFERAAALDPRFAMAWAQISLCQQVVNRVEPTPAGADAARSAAERAVELAPDLPAASRALALYYARSKDLPRAQEINARALKVNPNSAELIVQQVLLGFQAGETYSEATAELLQKADDLNPRSPETNVRDLLAHSLLRLRRTRDARAVCDRGLAISPKDAILVHTKVMTYLQEGDLAGAREVITSAPKEIDPAFLVRLVADRWDLDWVLDDNRREILLRLTPGAFDDDRGAWGIVLAQAASRSKDAARVREYAEEARKVWSERVARDDSVVVPHSNLGLSLAYLGSREEAIREGTRAVTLRQEKAPKGPEPYLGHLLARIHILCGNDEKAIDLLEELLKAPYFVTPGWLRIDPNFDPLRGNPRFQKLVAGH